MVPLFPKNVFNINYFVRTAADSTYKRILLIASVIYLLSTKLTAVLCMYRIFSLEIVSPGKTLGKRKTHIRWAKNFIRDLFSNVEKHEWKLFYIYPHKLFSMKTTNKLNFNHLRFTASHRLLLFHLIPNQYDVCINLRKCMYYTYTCWTIIMGLQECFASKRKVIFM